MHRPLERWLARLRAVIPGLSRPVPRRRTVTCYLRENGPVAYELSIFDVPRERVDAMMSSGLTWAWKTRSREWTELTRISQSAFLGDLPGGAILIAADADLPTIVSDEGVRIWIARFARTQPVPLAAVVTVRDGRELLFVQQHASDAVNMLLDAWGIDKRSARRVAYARLAGAALESLPERF